MNCGTSVGGIYVSGNLIGQRSPDVIGRLSASHDVIGCEDCKKSDWCVSICLLLVKKSVGLLLVKCLLFVCFDVVVNNSFVWCR